MKGYWSNGDYYGWLPCKKRYLRFASIEEYREVFEALEGSV